MNLFSEQLTKSWWTIISDLIADGVIKRGEDYLVEDDFLFLSFGPIHAAYCRRIVEKELPRDGLLSPPQLKKILMAERDYLYDLRKRMSEKVNVNCMVFLWNKQVKLPGKKLRKVS